MITSLVTVEQTHCLPNRERLRLTSYVQMDPLVPFQVTFLGEAFATGRAAVRPLSGVDSAVSFEVTQLGEAATAERAAERPLPGVSLQMSFQVAGVWKALSTLTAAQEMPGASVRAGVERGVAVIGAGRLMLGSDADPRGCVPTECCSLSVAQTGSRH